MALLGTNLTLLIGPTVAVPAPPELMENLERVEVTTSDSSRAGFQLTFAAGRSGAADLMDFPLLASTLLNPFNRVVLVVTFGGLPQVLIDGVIIHRELLPGTDPGGGTLTITGEDVSVLMDLEQKIVEHPAQDETAIATMIIGEYAAYGLIPQVTPPPSADPALPIERVPVQSGTDLSYLQQIADRFGYVFYVVAGPAPMASMAYWGPPVRVGAPQPALSMNFGPDTTVEQLSFRSDALAPAQYVGQVQDRDNNKTVPVRSTGSLLPALATRADWQANVPNVRTVLFTQGGLTATQALARAQGAAEASINSLTATGTLDALRYGHLLTPRGLVGLRGAGFQHDGLYYVKQVSHQISIGEYTQSFTLTREGVGATVPVVLP